MGLALRFPDTNGFRFGRPMQAVTTIISRGQSHVGQVSRERGGKGNPKDC